MANRYRQAEQERLALINRAASPGHKGKKPSLIYVASALINSRPQNSKPARATR